MPPRLPNWQSLVTPVLANLFSDLRISATIHYRDWWHHIHHAPSVLEFEGEHGVLPLRWPYNERSFAEVQRDKNIVCGTHAGFHDLFVPLKVESDVVPVLVTGPFALTRATSAEILERWHRITSSPARMSDPSFAQYVSETLSTLTLGGSEFLDYQRFVTCFATLMTAKVAPDALFDEAENLRSKLQETRAAERMWGVARSIVSERSSVGWATDKDRLQRDFGLERIPGHAVVGLLLGKVDPADPVDELLRRDAFQRACTAMSTKIGKVMCGQVGDHGVSFLVSEAGSGARARNKLTEIATQAGALARRFGLRLRAGISKNAAPASIPACYRAALAAAEMALTRDESVVYGEFQPEASLADLRKLRMELGKSMSERLNLIEPRFDHYVAAVLSHSGYRLEPIRTELDAGLERLAEPLLATGALDDKTFQELCTKIERAAAETNTVKALVGLYRQCASDIQRAIRSPTLSRRSRGIERAISFMREHAGEPLTRAQVARAAGFPPGYFSRWFKRNQGVTFESYLQQLRVARSKQMLKDTSLGIEAIAKLAGFSGRVYFHQVFRGSVGMTPSEYRSSR